MAIPQRAHHHHSAASMSHLSQPNVETLAPVFNGRAMSQRAGRPVAREKISYPFALVSTTNQRLMNAQDFVGVRGVSGTSMSSIASDRSNASNNSLLSHETVTDASSVEASSPVVGGNHLSTYFMPTVDTRSRSSKMSSTVSLRPSVSSQKVAPRHRSLQRKRSIPQAMPPPERLIQRAKSPPPPPSPRGREMRDSMDFFAPIVSHSTEAPKESAPAHDIPKFHVVAKEPARINKQVAVDPEVLFMKSRGLARFSAHDYMSEIESLISQMLEPARTLVRPIAGWL